MLTKSITLTSYTRRNRRDVMRLIQDHYRLHIHLDWNTVDEWLDEPDVSMLLAWREHELFGALAASPPLNGSTWIRLAAIHDEGDPDQLFGELWPPMRDQLLAQGVHEVGVLMLRPWLTLHMERLGFVYHENIVTLKRYGGEILRPLRSDLAIRHGDVRELDTVVAVDHAAFGPLWQLSKASLRQAIRSASSFTYASLNGQIVSYQISSLYRDGAHLARLATVPAMQGSGVGGALLTEMITGFARRGIQHISVNTQESNCASQHLYQRYGFDFTGLDMPVWTLNLENLA